MINQNQDIQGSANISRHLNVGGNADIGGTARIGHNLIVRGWLDAPNIKGPCKGLYKDEQSLKKAYPLPLPGWYALVGDTLPADVWRSEGAKWVATGEKGGEFSLYLDQLEQDYSYLWDFTQDIDQNLNRLREEFDALVGENASEAIDNFNEIIKFLEGIKDSENLAEKLGELRVKDLELERALKEESEARRKGDEALGGRIDGIEPALQGLLEGAGIALTVSPQTVYKGEESHIDIEVILDKADGENVRLTSLETGRERIIATTEKAPLKTFIEERLTVDMRLNASVRCGDYWFKKEGIIYARYPIFHGFGKDAESVYNNKGNRLGATTTSQRKYPSVTSGEDDVRYYILVPEDIPAPSQFTMGGAPYVMTSVSKELGGVNYTVFESGAVYGQGATVAVTAG